MYCSTKALIAGAGLGAGGFDVGTFDDGASSVGLSFVGVSSVDGVAAALDADALREGLRDGSDDAERSGESSAAVPG
jgi:hypothetical protein